MRELYDAVIWLWPWICEDLGGMVIPSLLFALIVLVPSYFMLRIGDKKN